jgi:hypothetical protein
MFSDIEIAQAARLKPIIEVAKSIGLEEDDIDLYGKYKAKIHLEVLDRLRDSPDGRLILVTGMTARRGQNGHFYRTRPSLWQARNTPHAVPAGAVTRADLRNQGRRSRRGILTSPPHG